MRSKLKIIIPIIIAVIAVIIAAVCIRFTPSETADISSLVSTAQKYLIEQNYEQAIAEFEKVIELDPMNVDAYISIAEAYEGMGDTEKAIEWLEKGYELTEDERILEMLERLRQTEEAEAVTESTASETVAATETTTVSETTAAPIEYTSEELEEVLLTLIENPDADIPQDKLDAIYTIAIYGDEYYAVNQHIYLKYDITSRRDSDHTSFATLTVIFSDGSEREVSRGSITNLGFLRRMKNLFQLDLWNNSISDISALNGLTNLTSLDLQRNNISDISALSGLTNLEYLYLRGNNISNISVLNKLTNLTVLDLDYNSISDISALSELTNLDSLGLFGNDISDSDIEALKQALPNCEIFS